MTLRDQLRGDSDRPNIERIARSVHRVLGVKLSPPSQDVLDVINNMTTRELYQFDNMRRLEGIQELFRAQSIRAVVDTNTKSLVLTRMAPAEIEKQLKAEQKPAKVVHLAERHATQTIVKPAEPAEPLEQAAPPKPPLPPAFEHLEAMEHLCVNLVDTFIRHGRLSSADKDVLKSITPTDFSVEARLMALERWQAEVTRRVRGISVPKATPFLVLQTEEQAKAASEELLVRRLETLAHWLGKLVKNFEATGVKFYNKPVWLPH